MKIFFIVLPVFFENEDSADAFQFRAVVGSNFRVEANRPLTLWVRQKALEGPAGMPEHRSTRRQVQVSRLAPARAPCASGISDNKPRDKDRRLKEKGEHGIHLVVPPRS
jgi:hypothetical protein